MSYKDTLLMPKTEFPMRGNLPNREPEMQQKWEDEAIYEKVQERTKGRPLFVLHDGPPYANGDLHMGHALNKVLKDFIVRYKSMAGFHAPYVPGWDTHGLPIEVALTKKKKINRKEVPVPEFREMCKQYALEQLDNQRTQFKQLGVRGDWDNPYITLNPSFEAQQIRVFGEMAKAGYIYKGKKPVYWSPSSESALAEAEIEYHDKKSPSIYVAFDVTNGNGVLNGDEKFVIWTTTPWTIPANLAIAVHPDLDYVVVSTDQGNFVIAEDLLEEVAEKAEWQEYSIRSRHKGKDLEYAKAQHPLYDRESLIILGDHVTTESGTGCVHTAPGHGEEDYWVGKTYGLDALCPVDEKGVFTEEAPGFAGEFYDKANKSITEQLNENGALLKLEFMTHSYPHDWRTKKPTIFRATSQWFASVSDFRNDLLDAIENVSWHPHWGETRMYNMVRDREDWCISRQRVWGVPIPVFYAENGEAIITDETIAHVSDLFREHGSNIWFERDANDLLPEGFTHPGSPNGEFTKETDIMDVWFDSGSTHQGVLQEREDLDRPADLYLEGSDQYRGWFNSSLTTAVAITGESPYKGILSHGFTLDGDGRKMSKSLGNVMVPSKIMKQLGADILRLWVASSDYGADVRVSNEILKQVSEVYRKIRNTMRFVLGNLHDFDPSIHRVAEEDLEEVDRYMLIRLQETVAKVRKAYDNYEFATIYHTINNFCTVDLSSFYLDFAKDVLYIEKQDSHRRRSIQTVYHEIVVSLTQLLSPILAHTADELWQHIPGVEAENVQLTDMPDARHVVGEEDTKAKWQQLMAVREDVLKALEAARDDKVIGKSLEAHVTIVPKDEQTRDLLESVDHLHQYLIVSEASVVEHYDPAKAYEHVSVAVDRHEGETCQRCWVSSHSVGQHSDHPDLCDRCADVLSS
ncbi:isoleucine--tRNA ligase [Alkalibacillus almallahensis]|uniref:isoleucine--tRNA ligase n=1 Tax=Alkalibacillus almallahensis TaxID=1379154 RepID=UPI001421FD86|nr:isoleucine--tRNA ligase [Alkalibacillus almallahensis]NIK10714.1 isoleucyl-tRNA synthetase [Alkalibacillus almallahensis]